MVIQGRAAVSLQFVLFLGEPRMCLIFQGCLIG